MVRNTRRDAHHDRLGASNELRHGPRGGEVFATLRAFPRSWRAFSIKIRASFSPDLLTPRPTLAQSGPRMGASKEVESLAARLEDFPGFDEMRAGSAAGSSCGETPMKDGGGRGPPDIVVASNEIGPLRVRRRLRFPGRDARGNHARAHPGAGTRERRAPMARAHRGGAHRGGDREGGHHGRGARRGEFPRRARATPRVHGARAGHRAPAPPDRRTRRRPRARRR